MTSPITLRGTQGGVDVDHVRAGHVVGALTASAGPRAHGGSGLATNGGAEAGHIVPIEQPFGVANCLTQRMHKGINSTVDEGQTPILVAFDTTQITSKTNESNPKVGDPCHTLARGAHAPAIAFSAKDYGGDAGDIAPTLRAGGHSGSHANGGTMPAVAFDARQSDVIQYGEKTGPLDTDGHTMGVLAFQERGRDGGRNLEVGGDVAFALTAPAGGGRSGERNIASGMQVRRLTPRECERLQGFPDDYTLIPHRGKLAADGPRYKALGNSWAVPVARWIGERIAKVDAITKMEQAA